MRINTNVASLNAREAATNTNNNISSSLEKLSTGLRINKASDDASGLAIADKLRTQASSTSQAISNGNSAVSLLQIADKSMAEQSNILDTVKAKLIQANTDTTSDEGREAIRKDIAKLLEQLDNIATQTNYNGISLLADVDNGSLTGKAADSLSFQIGASNNDVISTSEINSTTTSLGGGDDMSVSKIEGGESATINAPTDGQTKITSTGAGMDISVSGNLGTVTGEVATSFIVDPNDSALIAKLKGIADNDADFSQNATYDNVFTLTATNSVDLSSVDFDSVQITQATAVKYVTFDDSSNLTVTNNDLINQTNLTSTEFVSEGESITVSSTKTGATNADLTVTATGGTTFNATVSGNLGTLTVGAANLTLEVSDADATKIQALIDDGETNITKSTTDENKFTLTAAATLDFDAFSLTDAKITATLGSAGATAFSTDSSDEITFTNNASTEKLKLTNIDVKSGSTLATLKDLEVGGLTQDVASKFQSVVDDAISQLNSYRSELGSSQNQVESAVRNLQTQETNILAAESIIRDVDYAAESSNFNKQNIISQAGSYAMSQANSVQQNVLRLLQ